MRAIWARVRSLWSGLRRRPAFERDMGEEFQVHLELRTEDLIRSGLTPADAARRARVEFGGAEGHKEAARAARGLRLFDELRGDLRHAVRSLRRTPVLAGAAALTLALGVGANTAVFSLVNASLWRPLPFADPGQLVELRQTHAPPGAEARVLPWWSYPQVEALQTRLTTLAHVTGYSVGNANLSGAGIAPERVRLEIVSGSYFGLLGVPPLLGRGFLPEEDAGPGTHPVMVLGHALWVQQFGADPALIGRSLAVNGVSLTVGGVAAPGFAGASGEASVWITHAMAPQVALPEYRTSTEYFIGLLGRLRPGLALAEARAELLAVGAAVTTALRETGGADPWPGTWGVDLVSLPDARRDPAALRSQLVLTGTTMIVLLIAVLNLAGLLTARATARANETAVRAALGAGRLRLIRHAMLEGGVLGVAGGAIGILLTIWGVRLLTTFAPERLGGLRLRASTAMGHFAEPDVDWRVIGFAALVSLAAGLLAGFLPAVLATRRMENPLPGSARTSAIGTGSLRRPTVLSTTAVLQTACGLVLLAGAGTLLRELNRLRAVDPGFRAPGLVTFQLSLPDREFGAPTLVPLVERILDRMEAVPGVEAATVGCLPYRRCSWTAVRIEGRPATDPLPTVGRLYVGPDHFRTFGIPILRGRALTADDRTGRPRVAVINATAARRFWPGEDPLGKRVWFGGGGGFASPDSLTEIVGVAGDVLNGPPGTEVGADFYTSYLQYTIPATTVTVRAAAPLEVLIPALRRALMTIDPHLPLHTVRTMESWGREALASERFSAAALGVLAGLGLMLASVGVYGIMAYAVARRRREIGIRMALGMSPRAVLRLILAQGAALAAAGLALGTIAALWLSGTLTALMAGADRLEPQVLAAAAAVLVAVVLVACWVPARAAMRVDPVETLAAE